MMGNVSTADKLCPRCRERNPWAARWCSGCGAELPPPADVPPAQPADGGPWRVEQDAGRSTWLLCTGPANTLQREVLAEGYNREVLEECASRHNAAARGSVAEVFNAQELGPALDQIAKDLPAWPAMLQLAVVQILVLRLFLKAGLILRASPSGRFIASDDGWATVAEADSFPGLLLALLDRFASRAAVERVAALLYEVGCAGVDQSPGGSSP